MTVETSSEKNSLESENKTVISFCWKQGQLGAAIVHRETSHQVSLLEQQLEAINLPTVESLIHELKPDIVVIPGRGDYQFSETVEYILGHIESSPTELQRGLTLEYKATTFLSQFNVTDDLKKANILSIEAGSALLAAFKRCTPHQPLPIELEWFSMSDCMVLDYDSVISLQIMSDESHPNMHMSTRKAENGLSLSSLLNKCKSSAGRKLMSQWILRPLKTISAIKKRHDIVEGLVKGIGQRGLLAKVHGILYGIPRVEILLPKICKKISHAFIDLSKFLSASKELFNSLLREALEIHVEADTLMQLENLSRLLKSVIDIKQTKIQGKIVIPGQVDEELDRLRRQYNELPLLLNNSVILLADRVCNPHISKINIVYFPQLGFLVTVAIDRLEADPATLEKSFELQFVTERVAYYKDPMTRQLDDEIGDIHGDILDLETEIIHRLVGEILCCRVALAQVAHEMALVDCYLTLAEFAHSNSLVKPILVDSSTIEIKQGWHILQERVSEHVVRNNVEIGCHNTDRVTILTGPNGSGKSVYLKQVGLTIIMSQIGSFVPAESARLGVFDKIFTRIKTRESHASKSSAFQTDLLQVKRIVDAADEKSLVLIDEFGKGTVAEEGIAIFAATIKHLATQSKPPPTIAITHFHEIYRRGLLDDNLPIKWCTMDFVEDQQISFLYRVINGKASDSLGILCACKAGIPKAILEKAKELLPLYEADVPPISIRYAQIPASIEEAANKLIQTFIDGRANVNIKHLRQLSAELLNAHQ